MHPLLERQLKRYYGDGPIDADLQRLLEAVDHAYTRNDQDRALLEQSLEQSSNELYERYNKLTQQLQANKAAQRDLQQTLSLLDATFDATEEGILVIDNDGRVVRVNEVFNRIWQVPPSLTELNDPGRVLYYAADQVINPTTFIGDIQACHTYGRTETAGIIELKDDRIFEVFSRPQVMQGECIGRVWSFRDITEKKTAERKVELASKVFEVSTQGIMITDADLNIIDANHSLCEMLQLDLAALVDRRVTELESEDHGLSFNENFASKLTADGEWWGELRSRHMANADRVIWINFSTVHNEKGEIANYVGMFSDITKLKAAEDQLQQLAYFDPLTSLPNRRFFKEYVDNQITEPQVPGQTLSLLYLDLDRFKFVNDSLGHESGDQLLSEVANRIRSQVRQNDLVSRQGGDEFAIVLVDEDDHAAVSEVATRIIKALSLPFEIKGQHVYIGASIGICAVPEQAATFDEAVSKADAAMYLAKAAGKGRHCFWNEKTQSAMDARIVIERELHDAISQDQLMVHYQPIVDGVQCKPVAMEALLRWEHPQRGRISPDTFIPIAEENGLISAVEDWVIDRVCNDLQQWSRSGVPLLPVNINVSARHLADKMLRRRLLSALQRHQIPPKLICIEVTETTAMSEPEETIKVLQELQEIGVQSAIDDFGTGYSSLSYLKQLPANTLKIDRSFVRDIAHDHNDRDIAKAIVELGHSLSMEITAEGVEDTAQLAILRKMGCDKIQGWLFAKALPADEMAELLRGGSSLLSSNDNAAACS
ncbi:EAL domain-containing protein [Thiosocius teredinicola]|uniref:EAL domain-containing protein n=1 Tax=Thiosocius teredinicola TaxID=1973002 RepID=UPI000990B85E